VPKSPSTDEQISTTTNVVCDGGCRPIQFPAGVLSSISTYASTWLASGTTIIRASSPIGLGRRRLGRWRPSPPAHVPKGEFEEVFTFMVSHWEGRLANLAFSVPGVPSRTRFLVWTSLLAGASGPVTQLN